MRFIRGPIPESRTFDPVAAGWTPLREFGAKSFALAAMLGMLPLLIGAIVVLRHATPELRPLLQQHFWSLPCFLVLLLALVPAHEFIHALAYGCGLRSPNLIAGLWLRRGMAYVLYDAPLPRWRVLTMVTAPFLVLSVLPLVAALLLSGPWFWLSLFFSVLHAALCMGDAITFVRLLTQAPARALIQNQGWKTYWAVPATPSV